MTYCKRHIGSRRRRRITFPCRLQKPSWWVFKSKRFPSRSAHLIHKKSFCEKGRDHLSSCDSRIRDKNNFKKLHHFRQIMWQATRNLASGDMQMSCRVFLSLRFLHNAANSQILAQQLFNKAGLRKARQAFANWKILVIRSKQSNRISQTSLRFFEDSVKILPKFLQSWKIPETFFNAIKWI